MKSFTKIIATSIALVSNCFAEMPEALKGNWILAPDATMELLKTSPQYKAEAEKFTPTILKRMAQVSYHFEDGKVTASKGGKSQALEVKLISSEKNVHIFQSQIGEKEFTLTATINEQGLLNMKSSATNDQHYFLWKKGTPSSAPQASETELATEIIEKALEEDK